MARTTPRPPPTATHTLPPLGRPCPRCGETLGAASPNYRPVTPLDDVVPRTLPIRRCRHQAWPPWRWPYRPAAEGRLAFPQHAWGLDGIACVGTLREAQHRRLPDIPAHLYHRGGAVAPRTVLHRRERDDALRTRALTDTTRLQRITPAQGRLILALEGRQPDVGHAVLWGLRACLAGAVLLARRLVFAPHPDRAVRLRTGQPPVPVPMGGIVSDGQLAIRGAVAEVGPEVPPPPWGTSMLCARRRSPLMTPTAMPSTHAKSGAVGDAPLNGASQDGVSLRPQSCGAPGRPYGVPSRMLDAPPGSLGAPTPRPPHGAAYPSRAGRTTGAWPQEWRRLQSLRARGLMDTADVWPDVRVGERGGPQAAPILRPQD